VERRQSQVVVDANRSLNRHIWTTPEADGMSIARSGAADPAETRDGAVDRSYPVSGGRLSAKLSDGSAGRIVAVAPPCGPLGVRCVVRAGADSLVLEHEVEDALAPGARAFAAGLSAILALLGSGAERLVFSRREPRGAAMTVQPPGTRWIEVPVSGTDFLTASCLADAAPPACRFCAAVVRSRAD
jgi:hypothetical protein